MEIVHIVLGKANPERLNGVNKVVFNLASEQTKAGRKVSVWGITEYPIHDYPNRIFHTELFKSEKMPFRISNQLKEAILKNNAATYHLHGGWIPLFSSLAKLFAKHQIKFVITPHGAYNEVAMQRSQWIKKVYFHAFEKTILKHVHKVHSIGNSEVEGLEKIYPSVKSFLLPYGFDQNVTEVNVLKNRDFTIGFVGRLDTQTKGLDLLMEAFYQFQKTEGNSKLWIIGDGEGRDFIEKYILEKKINNVVLWGKKFGKEKDELISQMHVFAHPSRNEGLPTSVLEAASFGVPSIVSKATNVAAYVTQYQAGISIDNNNVSQLMSAMDKLCKAYARNQAVNYVSGARTMLEKVFDWPILVEKYDELYT